MFYAVRSNEPCQRPFKRMPLLCLCTSCPPHEWQHASASPQGPLAIHTTHLITPCKSLQQALLLLCRAPSPNLHTPHCCAVSLSLSHRTVSGTKTMLPCRLAQPTHTTSPAFLSLPEPWYSVSAPIVQMHPCYSALRVAPALHRHTHNSPQRARLSPHANCMLYVQHTSPVRTAKLGPLCVLPRSPKPTLSRYTESVLRCSAVRHVSGHHVGTVQVA